MKKFHAEGIEVLMEIFFPEGTEERLIFDCLEHWVRDYHVDGFYLIGEPLIAMNRFLARDPMFVGYQASFYLCLHTEKLFMKGKTDARVPESLAEHNDGFPRAMPAVFLKGTKDQLTGLHLAGAEKPGEDCASHQLHYPVTTALL